MNYGGAYSPPCKGGVDARSRKYREATLARADGVVRSAKSLGLKSFAELTTPSAALRRLRAFLLMPQPPLLFKEGKLRGAPPLAVSVITQERPQDPLDRALAGASAAHQFLFPLLQALSKFTKSGGANGPPGLREHVGFLFFRVMFHEIFQHLCFCRKFI